MKRLYVKTFRTKNDKLCTALFLDLGYCQKLLTFDRFAVCEILGVSPRELAERKENEETDVE